VRLGGNVRKRSHSASDWRCAWWRRLRSDRFLVNPLVRLPARPPSEERT
jgi:hypothetical protein